MSTKASASVSGATSTTLSSSSGPLFRTLFTARLTGHSAQCQVGKSAAVLQAHRPLRPATQASRRVPG